MFDLFFILPADMCVPISESVLSPHISALAEHNKLSTKDHSWRKTGKPHAKHSLKGELMLKTCPLETLLSVNTVTVVLFLSVPAVAGRISLLFTVCMSYRVHGRRQSTNYVDNYPSAHVSVSVSLKHSMGSREETTMPCGFCTYKAIQTLSLTAHTLV